MLGGAVPELTTFEAQLGESALTWLVDVAEDPTGWFRGDYTTDHLLPGAMFVLSVADPGGVSVPVRADGSST